MNKKLIALLALLGIQFANTADENANTETALDEIEKKITTFVNEKTKLDGQIEALTKEKTTFINERDAARKDLISAQTQFANERKARIADELALGISTGRITLVDRPTWETRLANEAQFANELDALRKLAPVVKTNVITLERNGKKVEIANPAQRTQIINELIAEEIATGKTLETAQAAVETKHPALFAAMKHPTIVMPKRRH